VTSTENIEEDIFPKDPSKSYNLVALMDRSSTQVDKGPEDTLFSFPVVLLWEIVLFLGVTLAIFIFSLIKQAPLEEIANPLVTTDPAKAPWYFVGLQELLEHMHPTMAGVIIPGILVGFLIILPYLDSHAEGAGSWFGTARNRKVALWTALYTLIVMPAYIVLDHTFSIREMLRDVAPQWVAQGLLPGLILGIIVIVPLVFLRRNKPTRREILTALFTLLIVSAFVYTASGFFFRGPGFKLYLPWSMPGGYNPFDGL
jgi:quinol-cytochrome oxidoreductase complex cytochrome b subunit